jgi:PAS domain S-box-containing protein
MPTLPPPFGDDPVYIALCDADERFLSVNAGYAARFGLLPADLVGRRIEDVVPPAAYARLSPYIQQVLIGETVEFTIDVPYDGLGLRRMHTSYLPQMGAGVVERFVAVLHDASARAEGERLRQRGFDDALAAQHMAETAKRMTDEFLATISHELSTPIGTVLGWVRILRDGQIDDDTRRRGLDAVERSAKATATMIEDLLDVSRVVTGELRIARSLVDLDELARRAVDAATPAALCKRQSLSLDVTDPGRPRVTGDGMRLQQVISNVLSNAIRYTPEGGRINVGVYARGTRAHIRISDTGQGISADVLQFLCEPFRQGDGSRTRLHGGLGLGLTIARHLIHLHGGTITAQSDGLGRGATFTIAIPMESTVSIPEQLTLQPDNVPAVPGRSN